MADCEVWNQGLFRVGNAVLDTLVRAVNGFDFGIFVFAPDDMITMRGKTNPGVRDNVVFELGIFVGKLGPQRSYFAVPQEDSQLHLPSDLSGIISARYESKNNNIQIAVASAVFEILAAIQHSGPMLGRQRVLYDSRRQATLRVLSKKESSADKDGHHFGDTAEGSLSVGSDGVLAISRSNVAGRFELLLRPEAPTTLRLGRASSRRLSGLFGLMSASRPRARPAK